jgi:hypothetical protein
MFIHPIPSDSPVLPMLTLTKEGGRARGRETDEPTTGISDEIED